MADEHEQMGEDAPTARGGWRNLLIYAVIAVIAAGAGFAVPLIFPHLVDGQVARTDKPSPPKIAFVPLGETVVNLNEDRLNRYLRISITLQIDETNAQQVSEVLENKKPFLKSWLLSYLSDKGMEDIRGAVGQNRIRREIRDQFNDVLFTDGMDRINDILFEEFNVQ